MTDRELVDEARKLVSEAQSERAHFWHVKELNIDDKTDTQQ